MTYTHRNGETEPPTVAGWYWWGGVLDGLLARRSGDGLSMMGLVKVNLPDAAFPTLTVSPTWVDGWIDIGEMPGHWWGPVLPPWEQAK